MIRKMVYAISVLCSLSPAFAEDAPLGADALEHWRRSTVAVGEVLNGSFITIGSGVLVTVDGKKACLLTAKHVLFDKEKGWTPTSVRIRLPKNSYSDDQDAGVELTLNDSNKAFWKSPDDGADLAVIDAPDLSKYWDINAVSINDFGDAKDVYQGANVLTLGYPMIPAPEYLITPIARGGIVAWIDPLDGYKKPFLIDSNIVHGNSGGPVFHSKSGTARDGSLALGGGYVFVGIVSKNATEDAPVHIGADPALRISPRDGKVEQYAASVENIGGIGVIEPVFKAHALVQNVCHN